MITSSPGSMSLTTLPPAPSIAQLSDESAAEGYAAQSGIPYCNGLVKNRYIGRTFIQPTQDMREGAVSLAQLSDESNTPQELSCPIQKGLNPYVSRAATTSRPSVTAMQNAPSSRDNEDVIMPVGDIAVGHVRYSTSGGNNLANVQPICVNTLRGRLALAHNGNLSNARLPLKNANEEVKNAIFNNVSKRLAVMIKEDMDFIFQHFFHFLDNLGAGPVHDGNTPCHIRLLLGRQRRYHLRSLLRR